jgi:hypothetical protein
LRFCIKLFPQYLQIGRGLVQRVFLYEDVDLISLHDKSSIILRAGKDKTKTVLPTESLRVCLKTLQAICPNAVIVDFDGTEYLPQYPTLPDKTLLALERRFSRKATLYILCAIWFGIFLIGHCGVIIYWYRGDIKPDNHAILGLCICTPAYVIMVFTGIKMAIASLRNASEIHTKRSAVYGANRNPCINELSSVHNPEPSE